MLKICTTDCGGGPERNTNFFKAHANLICYQSEIQAS